MEKKRLKNNFPTYLKVKGLMKKELFLIRNKLKSMRSICEPWDHTFITFNDEWITRTFTISNAQV